MTVSLKNTFFANARGITFKDSASITWTINVSTNEITASGGGGGPAAGNPTAVVGLTAVNGTAATFMRSDAAPPIDQSIAPTWTGKHTFNIASGIGVLIDSNGVTTALVVGGQTVSQLCLLDMTTASASYNELVNLVSTSSGSGSLTYINCSNNTDSAFSFIVSQVGAASKFCRISPNVNVPLQLGGSSQSTAKSIITGYGVTAAGYVDMGPDTGTFTASFNGNTVVQTGTAKWSKQGNQVTLVLPVMTGTSNATSATITGLPAVIQPATTQMSTTFPAENNTVQVVTASAQVSASGTITLFNNGNAAGWTASGTKGLNFAVVITYLLN